jgi:hypothetical protein
MKDEALKSVLEVLKAAYVPADLDEQREKAIAACEQALAAPVQPVAHIAGEIDHTGKVWKPAAQRKFVGLTDEERTEIRREHYARTLPLMDAVEAKLRSKNA